MVDDLAVELVATTGEKSAAVKDDELVSTWVDMSAYLMAVQMVDLMAT